MPNSAVTGTMMAITTAPRALSETATHVFFVVLSASRRHSVIDAALAKPAEGWLC